MKKLFLLISMMILAGISVLLINACSKSDTDVQAASFNRITEFNPPQAEVLPRILQFNESYAAFKQGLKAGEDMPLNEALWTMEAGVNYAFRSEKDNIVNRSCDSAFVTVGIYKGDDNQLYVHSTDYFDAYDTLMTITQLKLTENNSDNLLVADVEMRQVNDEQAEVKFTVLGSLPPASSWACEIQSDDYWYPVGGEGYCDGPNSGQGVGQDASTRINGIINTNHCADYGCEGTVFFTSVTTLDPIYQYENANGENCFWGGSPNDCLTPTQMVQWVNNAYYVVDSEKPSGKVFISANFTWTVVVSDVYYVHYYDYIKYGILNCSGNQN